jgi:hypothetical protein
MHESEKAAHLPPRPSSLVTRIHQLPNIMKILILLLALTTFTLAVDTYPSLSTKKGREYTSVTVTAVEPDGLRIRHESGTAKIPFEELPVEIQKKYAYDPSAADAHRNEYERNSAAQEAELDEAVKASVLKPKEPTAPMPPDHPPAARQATDPNSNPSPIPTRVKLVAATSSMGRDSGRSWQTSWGSYDESIFRARAVKVTVTAATGGDAVLELHWIGSQAGSPSDQGVVKVDRKSVTLTANQRFTHEFGALFVENDTKYAALGERYRDGFKYAGWVARLVAKNGATLAVQGARPPMIRMVE